jgi:hypothetical protein
MESNITYEIWIHESFNENLELISEIWACCGTHGILCIELIFNFFKLYLDLIFIKMNLYNN